VQSQTDGSVAKPLLTEVIDCCVKATNENTIKENVRYNFIIVV
jgi:hypothetical protein